MSKERVICPNSLIPQGGLKSLTTLGNNNLDFRITRDQVVHLGRQVCCASWRQTNIIYAVFAVSNEYQTCLTRAGVPRLLSGLF